MADFSIKDANEALSSFLSRGSWAKWATLTFLVSLSLVLVFLTPEGTYRNLVRAGAGCVLLAVLTGLVAKYVESKRKGQDIRARIADASERWDRLVWVLAQHRVYASFPNGNQPPELAAAGDAIKQLRLAAGMRPQTHQVRFLPGSSVPYRTSEVHEIPEQADAGY